MANMFCPILTEETRDFSVLGVNILYLLNQQMSPSALAVLRSLICARMCTQIPSQYTHIDLGIDPSCQDDVHYLQVAVLLLCYFPLRGQIRGKDKKKKERSSPIAI